MAEASRGVWAGSFCTAQFASDLDMTPEEVSRHTRALVRLGMIEQM
jgi:DNA-binding transcriptional ArsR family regulator